MASLCRGAFQPNKALYTPGTNGMTLVLVYSSYSGNGMTLVQTCMCSKQTFGNRKSKSCFGGSAAVTSGFGEHLTLRPKHSRKRAESERFIAYVMVEMNNVIKSCLILCLRIVNQEDSSP